MSASRPRVSVGRARAGCLPAEGVWGNIQARVEGPGGIHAGSGFRAGRGCLPVDSTYGRPMRRVSGSAYQQPVCQRFPRVWVSLGGVSLGSFEPA